MDPLSLLSFQTISGIQFNSETVDYNTIEVLPNSQRYLEEAVVSVAAASLPIDSTPPTTSAPLFRTQARMSIEPKDIDPTDDAPGAVENDSKLYLALACGNCARAFGSPLVCALTGLSASPLNVCDSFVSPTSIS
jgi:hypothetical protein